MEPIFPPRQAHKERQWSGALQAARHWGALGEHLGCKKGGESGGKSGLQKFAGPSRVARRTTRRRATTTTTTMQSRVFKESQSGASRAESDGEKGSVCSR